MKRYIQCAALMAVCLLATAVQAAEVVNPEDMPDLIQQRYETLKTFKADFVQELTNVASGEVDERKGQIWFKQPSQVRWDTEQPEKELLVMGPEVAWNYIESEELALKYNVSSILDSKTILRFISGKANLKEDFVIRADWEGAEQVKEKWGRSYTVLKLIPKEAEPGMVLAYVGVEPDTGLLRQVMIVDFYGNGNELRLSDVELNVDLTEDMFTFTPPAGTQIEDNTQGY